MTCVGAVAEPGFATHYEQLRRGVIDGTPSGCHFGLVVLMREGVAAWMADAAARPPTATQEVAKDRPHVTAVVAADVHADMVAVFASMVMTTHKERCA